MLLNELKKGLWGFQKNSVYRYIDSIEKEYSEAVNREKEVYEKKLSRFQEEIETLTAQNLALEEELREIKKETARKEKIREELEKERITFGNEKLRHQKKEEEKNEEKPPKERTDAQGKFSGEGDDLLQKGADTDAWNAWLDHQVEEIRNRTRQGGSRNMRLFQRRNEK